jgi:ornithine carbamoyltransferase
VPVINGLSDLHHPCQVLADLQTLKQCFGEIRGLKVAYIGDGNNILHSLLLLVPMLGGHVSYACPAGYQPNAFVVKRARAIAADCGGGVTACKTPQAAVKGADALYTDVWTSMGFEAEAGEREQAFRGFQLNAELYAKAAPDAIILHCLPMVRGKEITDEMAEHPRSRIFRQAENRLHAQKALLLKVLA